MNCVDEKGYSFSYSERYMISKKQEQNKYKNIKTTELLPGFVNFWKILKYEFQFLETFYLCNSFHF